MSLGQIICGRRLQTPITLRDCSTEIQSEIGVGDAPADILWAKLE